MLRRIAETEEYTLDVDCEHLRAFDLVLYKQLEDYPTDVIPIFDLVALQVFKEFIHGGAGVAHGDGSAMQNSNMQEYE